MNNICVIFDLDGTLVDSEGLCNQAFLELLRNFSLPTGSHYPQVAAARIKSDSGGILRSAISLSLR